jgi:hypothetical protein
LHDLLVDIHLNFDPTIDYQSVNRNESNRTRERHPSGSFETKVDSSTLFCECSSDLEVSNGSF